MLCFCRQRPNDLHQDGCQDATCSESRFDVSDLRLKRTGMGYVQSSIGSNWLNLETENP